MLWDYILSPIFILLFDSLQMMSPTFVNLVLHIVVYISKACFLTGK